MVSPLSSRILDLEAKAKSINCPQVWSDVQVKKESVNPSDKTCSSTSGASILDQKKTGESVGFHAKKRKIEEMNYLAANVHADLARANITHAPCVAPQKSLLPNGSNNTVQLINVSRKTPYIEEFLPKTSDLSNVTVFSELVRLSEQFYCIQNDKEITIDRGGTATCFSPTNSFPKSGEAKKKGMQLEIPAKFEDLGSFGITKDEGKEVEDTEYDILKDAILRSTTCCSNLEEVLDNQSSARLVTESNEPHMILHASAAFSQLTGIASDKLIGRPLANIVKIDSIHESNNEVAVSFAGEDEDYPSPITRCSLMTSKVFSGSKMTHLSIDIVTVVSPETNIYDYSDELDSVLEFIALSG